MFRVQGGQSINLVEWFRAGQRGFEYIFELLVSEIDFESSFAELNKEGRFSEESQLSFIVSFEIENYSQSKLPPLLPDIDQ